MHRRSALDAILYSLLEYGTLTIPVLLYVGLESFHEKGLLFLLTSPEWGIATVFLSIYGPRRFQEEVAAGGHELSGIRMRFLSACGLIVAFSALINCFLSFTGESNALVIIRMAMFVAASMTFVALLGAARHKAQSSPRHAMSLVRK